MKITACLRLSQSGRVIKHEWRRWGPAAHGLHMFLLDSVGLTVCDANPFHFPMPCDADGIIPISQVRKMFKWMFLPAAFHINFFLQRCLE